MSTRDILGELVTDRSLRLLSLDALHGGADRANSAPPPPPLEAALGSFLFSLHDRLLSKPAARADRQVRPERRLAAADLNLRLSEAVALLS